MKKLILSLAMAAACLKGASVKNFGALGDGVHDDTAAIQNALHAACSGGDNHLYFPTGTYSISSSLVTGCSTSFTGDGPMFSVIFMTVQRAGNHGIIANYPFSIQDMGVNTTALTDDLGMVGVFRSDTFLPSAGQKYSFVRFYSWGFNFGIDIAGVGNGPDKLGSVVVMNCVMATATSPSGTAVSEPLNVRAAESLTVENNMLIGDGNGDHGIYVIGIRKLLVADNVIKHNHDSSIKVLTGGFGSSAETVCDAGQDYQSWTVRNNLIQDSAFAGAFYTYCDTRVPVISFSGNSVTNMTDTYVSNGATLIFEASCSSEMAQVTMGGNSFLNVTQGAVLIQSAPQFPLGPCPSAALVGKVSNFSSRSDQFTNWSTLSAGTYFAISANGPSASLVNADVSHLTANGWGNGRGALNLGAFAQVSAVDITQIWVY